MVTPYQTIDPNDPDVGSGTGQNPNPGNQGGWFVLLSYTLNLNRPALLEVSANYKQSHAGSSYPQAAWAVQLLIDGAVVDDGWGGAPCDKVNLLGGARLQAGSHTVVLRWAGGGQVTVYRPRMNVSWSYK